MISLESGFVEGIEQEEQKCQDQEGGKQALGLIHLVRRVVVVVIWIYMDYIE